MRSNPTPLASRTRSATRLTVAAGLGSFLLSLMHQHSGVLLSPDGWAYWEGSVSLLSGEGYRYFGGQPITHWPPGFSLYLALWQALLGRTAGAVAVAHAAAIGIATAFWIAAANLLNRPHDPGWRRVALAVVVALLLPIALRRILSESLFLALFGVAVVVALGGAKLAPAAASRPSRAASRLVLFVLVLSALLLTRHQGAAFVPALVWLYWRSTPESEWKGSLLPVIGGATAMAIWIAGRALLGQLQDHARIELDQTAPGRIFDNLRGHLLSAWGLLMPASLLAVCGVAAAGAVVYLGLRLIGWPGSARPRGAGARDRSGLSVATGLAAVAGAVVWVLYGVFGPRFVLPVVGLFLLLLEERSEQARSPSGRRLAAAVLACLALVQLARGGYWARSALQVEPHGIEWRKRLVPACAPGDAGCRLGADEIAPPDFFWIERDDGRQRAKSAAAP